MPTALLPRSERPKLGLQQPAYWGMSAEANQDRTEGGPKCEKFSAVRLLHSAWPWPGAWWWRPQADFGAAITRVDWTPGGGLVGDLWKFRCPAGGSVSATVDTIPKIAIDDQNFVSGLDPRLQIFDGQGNLLAAGDDDVGCTVDTQCGAGCPEVTSALRPGGQPQHPGARQRGPAGVHRRRGLSPGHRGLERERSIPRSGGGEAGGGPARRLPPWLLQTDLIGAQGPVVDNGSAVVSPPDGPAAAGLASLKQPSAK